MSTQPLTLLVVDDFLLMRQVIKRFLRLMGYDHILEAKDGAAALLLLRQQPIDLVLADWDMPQMDGLSLLSTMRTDAQLCTIPVVMITAAASKDDVVTAMQAGAHAYIVKPFTCKTLQAKITEVLSYMAEGAQSCAGR
ncbi:MAG TPA: response regulator [Candidatus Tectomicrobia bacterium]|jgi:two-component system chemotaxis response regulator CheY